MTNNKPGWAVEVSGEKFDLDDFRELLASPFDPWVEDYQTDDGVKHLLRSVSWTKLTDAGDVIRDANRIIDRLNGEALLIRYDAKPVKVVEPIKFGSDGKREHILFAGTGRFQLTGNRAKLRAGTVSEAPKPPLESRMQRWFREAETDDTLAELFVHLIRTDNWYDLYKSAELTRRLVGGTDALKMALGSEWRDGIEFGGRQTITDTLLIQRICRTHRLNLRTRDTSY